MMAVGHRHSHLLNLLAGSRREEALSLLWRKESVRVWWLWLIIPGVAIILLGCQTLFPFPTLDTTRPGWKIREGQAVWRPPGRDFTLAGDLVMATHADGSMLAQFSKIPMPLVVAQTISNAWQIEFVPERRRYNGHGTPPARILWLHLRAALAGQSLPKRLRFTRTGDGNWRLQDTKSGESLEGYLNP